MTREKDIKTILSDSAHNSMRVMIGRTENITKILTNINKQLNKLTANNFTHLSDKELRTYIEIFETFWREAEKAEELFKDFEKKL